ncbi:type 2 lanthipeptide synthetase LanM [Niallia sp. BSM11]|uniref:type 2 lanthipeptide synthetase LanM n=1 Tax=Niallia sp. BSM11 TaxID=3391576 RepID=UPI00398557AD
MLLKEIKQNIQNGKHFDILGEILDNYDFSEAKKQENIYDFLGPFVNYSCSFVQDISLQYKSNINDIQEQFKQNLAKELMNPVVRSLVLELQIKKLEYTGDEEDSSKRLLLFLYDLSKDKNSYANFFNLYEQLLILLLLRMTYFIENFLNIIRNLNKDFDLINEKLGINKEDSLTSINLFLGDSHNNGKVVSEVDFKNKSIIYKPRNNDVSTAFDNLLIWLSKNSAYTHYSPTRINKRNHAWEEKVSYATCETEEEISEYYTNFGYIAGVAFLLNGSDYHYENLIAHKQHPVLIDNETLLQPNLHGYPYDILSTGLFPNNNSKVNINGLTGDNGLTNKVNEVLINLDNDNICFSKEYYTLPSQYNIPQINSEKVTLNTKYKKNIVDAIRDLNNILVQHKDFLLSEESPLNDFKRLKIRVIFRPTMKYHEIMVKSTHPDYIKSYETQKDFISNNLQIFEGDIKNNEILSILNFDIPYFYTYADENIIYVNNDVKTSYELLQTPYSVLIDKIKTLKLRDFDHQVLLLEEILGLDKHGQK